MSEQSEARRVPVERLCGFIERALATLGMPDADARTVASLMAEADALGSDGHGIFRLPHTPGVSREEASNCGRASGSSASAPAWRSSTATTAWATW